MESNKKNKEVRKVSKKVTLRKNFKRPLLIKMIQDDDTSDDLYLCDEYKDMPIRLFHHLKQKENNRPFTGFAKSPSMMGITSCLKGLLCKEYELDSIEIQFSVDTNTGGIYMPLLNLVNGMVMDEKIYYHNTGAWYEITNSGMNMIDYNFISALEKNMNPTHFSRVKLSLPWHYNCNVDPSDEHFKKFCDSVFDIPANKLKSVAFRHVGKPSSEDAKKFHIKVCNKTNENEYCQLYLSLQEITDLGQESYFVGDCVIHPIHINLELFDLMEVTKETLYLFHIKSTIGEKTRVACSQIRNAAKLIQDSLLSKGKTAVLSNWFNVLTKTNSQLKHRKKVAKQFKLLTKEKFIKLFKEREIVFVYAFSDDVKRRKTIIQY